MEFEKYIEPINQETAIEISDKTICRIGNFTYGPIRFSYFDYNTQLLIGKYCSIATSLFILGGNHRTDFASTYPFPSFNGRWGNFEEGAQFASSKGDIIIGNDVWICHGSTILSGVTIGDGAVVSAGAMVTKDIPPYHIASGLPATNLRPRFAERHIELLKEMRWWDWPPIEVKSIARILFSGDFDLLRKAWEIKQRFNDAS